MSVSDLSRAQCIQAIHQMATSKAFQQENRHLNPDHIAGLTKTPPVWPNKPVYTPYALTKQGYSQVTFKVKDSAPGKKYLMHRIAYKAYYGRLDAKLEVSHLLWLGVVRTSMNINPRTLELETGVLNRSRQNCCRVMETEIQRWREETQGMNAWERLGESEITDNNIIRVISASCLYIHGGGCQWDLNHWRPMEVETPEVQKKFWNKQRQLLGGGEGGEEEGEEEEDE